MDRLAFNGLGSSQPITTRLAASLGVNLRRHILVTPPPLCPLAQGQEQTACSFQQDTPFVLFS